MFRVCLFAPAIVVTLLGAGSAAAQRAQSWRWTVLGDDATPYLAFEDAARQESRFALICDNQRREADVTVAETNKQARRGQTVTVELTANGRVVTMKGKVATDNGVYGHVRKAPYQALVALLHQPGPAMLKMTGNPYTLAERDRVKQLNAFTAICKLK
jgi:hypothetical protein